MAPRSTPSVTARTLRHAWVGLGLGLPLGVACSLALDLNESQPCVNNDDCIYTTGQGTCVDGLCQPPGEGQTTEMATDPTMGTEEPTTSADTTEGSTGPTICEANSTCADDERCSPDGLCVSLLSAECTTILWPDDERDDVEFLGSIMPVSPPFDALVEPLQNAHQLAVSDFNDHATLQSGQKIAWVGCDSTGGAEVATRAAEHLRDNVGVHAIVGPVFSEAVRQVADDVTVPGDIFVISPTASAPSLSNFDDDNLVWRVTPSDIYQGNAIVDRFTIDLGIDASASRVMVLNKDDAYGNELRDLVGPELDGYFDNIYFASYPPPENFSDPMDQLAAYAEVLAQALGEDGVTSPAAYANPEDHYTHIIILGTTEAGAFITSYLNLWEQQYFEANDMIPLPLITVSHGAVPQMEQIMLAANQLDMPEANSRLFTNLRGTSPNIFDPENFMEFNFRYQVLFPGEEAITSSSLSYDAAMAAMFAMVTIPEGESITGAGIAAGMASLNDPAGTPISFGDLVGVFIQDARNTLAAGNTVDLQGVSGALDWDPTNGEIRADVLGWNLAGSQMNPSINPYCIYLLGEAPATEGIWLSNATMMPPCG
ncbi:MAG: ABC transporter substrate-binding protein [Myxococcota bacterium]